MIGSEATKWEEGQESRPSNSPKIYLAKSNSKRDDLHMKDLKLNNRNSKPPPLNQPQ